MKVFGFLAFALLSISILSFGLTGAVSAQSLTIQGGLPLSVETDNGRVNPSDCAFTAPVNPKDRIEIDNNVNAKNPDNFMFILNHFLQYLYFQSN